MVPRSGAPHVGHTVPPNLLELVAAMRPWIAASGGLAGRRAQTAVRGTAVRRAGLLLATTFALLLGVGTADAATLVADGPAHGDVLDPVVLTPDGRHVLFLADLATDHQVELWSAPVSGGGATRISPALDADADVYGFAVTPDGARVVYLADQRTDDVLELFTMPAAGGRAVALHGALPGSADVRRFALSADGLRVVFLADRTDDGAFGMYSVAAVGGPVVELTAELPSGIDVDDDFLLTRDGTRAVLRADMGDRVHDLFTVRLDGSGEPELLSADVLSERGVEPGLVADRDGTVVSFRMEVEPGVFHRWAVPTDASADAALVHPELPERARGADAPAVISSDGSSIVFVADHATPGRAGVWLAPTNGASPPRELSGRMAGDGVVHEVRLTDDDTTAVYLAEQRGEGLVELFAASLDTVEGARRVSRSMVRGGDVAPGFEVLPDSSGVVYRADARRNGQVELYRSSLQRRGSGEVLSMDLHDDGDVAGVDEGRPAFQVSWDGTEVLFLADAERDGDVELFTVASAGGEPQRLNDHVDGRSVEDVTAMVAGRVGFVTVDSANQSDEDVYVAATQAPPAPLDPDAQFGPDGAVVSWDPPDTDVPVDGYVITVTPGGTTVEVGGDATSVDVDALAPGVTYVFTVRAVNDAGTSPGSSTEPGAVPEPPAAVASIDVVPGARSLTATWVPGRGGSTVDAFVVRVLPGGDPVQVPSTVRDLTVVGLDPAVGHTFEVTAVGPRGHLADGVVRTGPPAAGRRHARPPRTPACRPRPSTRGRRTRQHRAPARRSRPTVARPWPASTASPVRTAGRRPPRSHAPLTRTGCELGHARDGDHVPRRPRGGTGLGHLGLPDPADRPVDAAVRDGGRARSAGPGRGRGARWRARRRTVGRSRGRGPPG